VPKVSGDIIVRWRGVAVPFRNLRQSLARSRNVCFERHPAVLIPFRACATWPRVGPSKKGRRQTHQQKAPIMRVNRVQIEFLKCLSER
jgi:hypothetical protein